MIGNNKILGAFHIEAKILHLIGLELEIITALAASGMNAEIVANKLCPKLRYFFVLPWCNQF
jgi:hypothetical protein